MKGPGAAVSGDVFVHSVALMGTVVTIQVMGRARDEQVEDPRQAVTRALDWFRQVEESCSRFDPGSEVMQLAERIGTAVPVSAVLFHATEVALAVAADSDGAFDPTIGRRMAQRGFNTNYRTGQVIASAQQTRDSVSFRDVLLDPRRKTITLRQPLVLDLGAVAKGLAIDLAARELSGFASYAIDAGGDLFLAGRNPHDQPWRVGIRHPRDRERLLTSIRVTDRAVCTSGDYERPAPGPAGGHHIIDPRGGDPVDAMASVTVVARTAVLADALGTAAFVLGARDGMALLERHGIDGVLVTSSLEQHATRGMYSDHDLGLGAAAVLSGDAAILHDTKGAADRRPDDPGGARRSGRRARTPRARAA
jgi:thiamine biosynthesis lipoprotein